MGGSAKSGASAAVDAGKSASGAAAAPAETSASDSGSAPAKSRDGVADEGKSASGDAPVDSERTAVFRAVRPGSGSGSAPGGAPADAAKPAAGESADSERTAVFRAVRPGSGSGSGSGSGGATTDAVKPGSGAAPASAKPAKPAASDPADSERTAVFRVPKPGTAEPAAGDRPGTAAPAAGERAGDRPAAFRAVKPGAAAPKDSTFVPLRTDDAEAGQDSKPKSQPDSKPTVTAPPAAPRPPVDHSERTTQQPLPPRPPLDLLADLTNNPPPPPSPMRTAIRRLKIYTPIVVLLAVILAVVQLVRPLPQPKLVMTAKSSFTFDGAAPQLPWPSEGQAYMAAAGLGTLGQSGEQKPVPIASVTKSMTAYIIMRDHPFKKGEKGAMIDVDKTAENEGQKDKSDNESTLNTVKEGDKISEYDAIAALMIPSANNIARLLARWDSGTQEAFVKKMNDTAKELGMTNTTYTDPSGLDATTVSTAEDQVKLGLKIVEMDAMIDITRKPSWIDPSGKKWDNWNRLVPGNDSLGIKTGTTTKAGGNLLFAAQKKVGNTNQLIVGAVLGQHKAPIIDTVIAASKQLLVATQKSLDGAVVVKKGEVVGYVDDGLGGQAPVVATADVQAVGWAALTVKVKLSDGGGAIPQTAKAGTEVGVLTVGEGASQVKVPVALKGDLVAPTVGSKLTRLG
ncbi:D-alanyl-D-alanine carboxypeptidase family protein [Streptomyces sp. NPDC059385]|uniref:D-alanyl-D-alanine carboxypeptidase family protein n=1 Tax=Streptomyces sp. NPDC059385 TaxID=3346817 RepID=UPI00369FFA98